MSLYRSGHEADAVELLAMFPANGPGAAVIVQETAIVPTWCDATGPVLSTSRGDLYRSQGGENVFFFAGRTARVCHDFDGHSKAIAKALDLQVVPFVLGAIQDAAGFVYQPVRVSTSSSSADIASNWCTDGICFTVGVTNHGTDTQVVTVDIDEQVGVSLGGLSYSTQTVSLGPGVTEFLFMVPDDVGGIDVQAAITDAVSKLATLTGLGYDTAAGTAVLARAQDLLDDSREARALAAYTAAVRIPYVLTVWTSPYLMVTVRRIGIVGEAASAPVSGAAVQILWPRNAREEGVGGVTDPSGVCALTPGVPLEQIWDWGSYELADPPEAAGDLVEVQVCTPDTGMAARRIVAIP
jgi:hypothetical protein